MTTRIAVDTVGAASGSQTGSVNRFLPNSTAKLGVKTWTADPKLRVDLKPTPRKPIVWRLRLFEIRTGTAIQNQSPRNHCRRARRKTPRCENRRGRNALLRRRRFEATPKPRAEGFDLREQLTPRAAVSN